MSPSIYFPSEILLRGCLKNRQESVKTGATVHRVLGFDGAESIKERKRLMTVGSLGLIRRVLGTAAHVGDRNNGNHALKRSIRYGWYKL